jgi:undecaprenyl-diphosphatase
MLATAALVLLTADVAIGGAATHVDDDLTATLDRMRDPVPLLSDLAQIGLLVGIVIVVVLVAVQATFRLWPAFLAAGTVGGGLLLVLTLKAALGRPGPGDAELAAGYPGFYPSGHASTAGLCLGTACFILMTWRGYGAGRVSPSSAGIVVGLVAAAGVGVASVVNGHHWATDAAGSVLLVAMVLPVGFAACRLLMREAEQARSGAVPESTE